MPRSRVHEIPNFVDTEVIVPADRHTAYRAECGLGDGPVVLYGGNVGFSQSLDLVLGARASVARCHGFSINGDGAARVSFAGAGADLPNVVFRGLHRAGTAAGTAGHR